MNTAVWGSVLTYHTLTDSVMPYIMQALLLFALLYLDLNLPFEVKIRKIMICNVSSEVPSGKHTFEKDMIIESVLFLAQRLNLGV